MTEKINEENMNRKVWTYAETIAFLECYANRKDEFKHARKKRQGYEKVLNDLISRNILTQPTTVQMLETKMKTLLRSCKTSSGSYPPPHMKQLQDIFGDELFIANSRPSRNKKSPLEESYITPECYIGNTETNITSEWNETSEDSFEVTSPPPEPLKTECNTKDELSFTSQERKTSEYSSFEGTTSPYKSKKNYRQIFYDNKIKLKEDYANKVIDMLNEMENNKQKRFREAEMAKERRHKEKMDLLRSFLENK